MCCLLAEYDKDGNGFLTKKELAALAMAINNQVLEAYRSAQRKAHPNYSAKVALCGHSRDG